jgi:hypothetical protein
MSPSALIAIDVILLYTLLGPLVLFAVYVLFDRISRDDTPPGPAAARSKKDPALWSARDIDDFFDQA